MNPNWPLLWYLVCTAVCVAAGILLATIVVVTWILGMAGVHTFTIDAWLMAAASITLGVLPWPGLVVLARALLKPERAISSVVSREVGAAAVVLVALNEAQAVEKVVRDFKAHPNVRSVIVVDNGSSDQTVELAERAGAPIPREDRRGYGFACQRALREGLQSGYSVVVLCEADRTFRAGDIDKLTAYLSHTDLVIGSRTYCALLDRDSQLNSFFVLGNVFIGKLLQIRYWDWKVGGRTRLTDVGCTYLAFHAEALTRIISALEVGGNHFVPHMLMVALERGFSVVQVPVTFWPRLGISKGGNASWGRGPVWA